MSKIIYAQNPVILKLPGRVVDTWRAVERADTMQLTMPVLMIQAIYRACEKADIHMTSHDRADLFAARNGDELLTFTLPAEEYRLLEKLAAFKGISTEECAKALAIAEIERQRKRVKKVLADLGRALEDELI